MAGNIGVELNLVVGKINSVLLNFITNIQYLYIGAYALILKLVI